MPRKKDPALEAQRRAQLLDAVIELLGEEAYHAVTQDRVAQHAGVSKGLLTYYYPEKDALFIEAIRRYHARERDRLLALVALPGLDAEQKLTLLIEAAFASGEAVEREVRFQSEVWSYAKDRPTVRAALRESYVAFRSACAALLDAGRAEGFVHTDDPEGAYLAIHALLDGMSFQLAVEPDQDLAALRRHINRAIRAIIGAPPLP